MRSLRRLVLALTVLAGATLIAFGATRLVRAATGSSVVRTRHLIGSAAPLPRLYAASSPFNRPIPADAPVDAQSDLLVHSLVEAAQQDGALIAVGRWTVPVYVATAATPRYRVSLTAD